MPNGFLPSGDHARTLTAWMQPTKSTSMVSLVYWGSGNCTGLMFGLGDTGDLANFWGGCNDYYSKLSIPVGAWTFEAIVYSPETPTTITFYVGALSATGTISVLTTANTGSLIMGADLPAGTSFTGTLGSIRVYGHALEAAEVESIFISSAP